LLGLTPDEIPWWVYLIVAAVLIGFAYLFRYRFFVRLPLAVLRHTLYRLRVHGLENLPATGPALLVCNPLTHLDALLLLAAQKRRIRFVVWAPYPRFPGLRLLLRVANVVPIDTASGPRAILQSLREASDALARGEVVCLFAEGGAVADFALPFHRAFEQVIQRSPAPVIPVCVDNVWGSLFSYWGRGLFWKRPLRVPYPVCVGFGAPRPATAGAVEVRQAIQKLSADCSVGRADQRLPLHRRFVRTAVRHPLRVCLIDPNSPVPKKVFRYGEILAGAKIFARRLRPLLGDERMVGLWLPPSAGGAVANITLALLGKVAVNLNYTSSPECIRSALQQCGIRHVLTSERFLSKVKLDPGPGVELVPLEQYRATVTKWERLRALLSVLLLPRFVQERWILGLGEHRSEDLATVIFSSGSTGDPKGVMLTHGNIAANAESMIEMINLRPRDRLLGVLPFFHSFGYAVTLWGPLQIGSSVVYHVDPRQSKEIGELCRTHGCTIYLTTPTFLRFCLRRCEPDDFRSVRFLVCGAEKLPAALAQEFKERFGVEPLEGYGCTELSPVVSTNVPGWERGGVRQLGNRPGTIGQLLPGQAARVVHPETFEPLPAGQEGLLLVYGANVMQGYLGRPELTAEALRDGWYVTGDIARYDEDGYLTITDRLSRFSKIGGEMVPHQKVEDELHALAGATERTFVVTAVPDEGKGERLVVLHVAVDGLDARGLWQGLSGKGLPNLWVPRERDFIQVSELPVLGSGKVDLKRVKELALERTLKMTG
jgi:acyl-[acyl-carrier-protein]-phospholipid O-acyltransferase/long-chain-fatty-acid--[acyl-carrier-protein] ligase